MSAIERETVVVPLPLIVGEMPNAHPSVAFLIRPWTLPTLLDGLIMVGLRLIWAGWMYLLSRAYSLAQASVAAPFEYVSLPINMMWGCVAFLFGARFQPG